MSPIETIPGMEVGEIGIMMEGEFNCDILQNFM
jgi:hypothetical protein